MMAAPTTAEVLAHIDQLTAAGMTKQRICHLASINPSMMAKYAQGLRAPAVDTASRILAITPDTTAPLPVLTEQALAEEWPHMTSVLGIDGAVGRLANAYHLPARVVRARAVEAGLL